MNSCLYECSMMHHRLEKKNIKFSYKYFMFYLDLDEIDLLSDRLKFFSRNKFNLFAFRDKDHLVFRYPDVKKNILEYMNSKNVDRKIGKIKLLTNVAVLGYNFNPVSFYFCFDKKDNPICVVPEVGNTFGELKPFFINKDELNSGVFSSRQQKNFYVSPFIEHDIYFDFKLQIPDETFTIKIDDYKNGERIFLSSLHGVKEKISDKKLLYYFLKYPLVTFKVIISIHWQAAKLYLKKMKYFKKNEFLELQQGAFVKWKEQNY